MTERDLDYYLNMHKQMWLDMAKCIAHCQHTIDIYRYKLSWCSRRNLSPFNKCFACQCAIEIKWDAGDVEDCEMYFNNMCTYCPLCWPGDGDQNNQFFCECNYNFDGDGYGYIGLWMVADKQHDLEKHGIIVSDKFWKKQCKLCYKIAMLPVDEDVVRLVTESLICEDKSHRR